MMMTPATRSALHRFTVDEYYKMLDAGILCEDDRVELLDGQVVDMTPVGPDHNSEVARLNLRLVHTFGGDAIVWVQSPIHLDEHNDPLPDLVLLRLRPDFYRAGNPRPADVLLLIEVAYSSLEIDRGVKMRLYAGAGIPEYGLVDLQHGTLILFRDPTPDGYGSMRTLSRGDHFAPLSFPDREIAVTDLLGEA